jgi:hypothetical protein
VKGVDRTGVNFMIGTGDHDSAAGRVVDAPFVLSGW